MGKVLEETMLVMVDTKNNNNKFYHVTLQDDNTVTKRWGRVGAEGAVSTDRTGKNGYDRAIASKQKKGYKVSPITNTGVTVTTKGGNHLPEIAQKYLAKDPTDTTIQDLINRLVTSNAHQILEQSGGQIKVDEDGTVKTALGIVDLPAINEARTILTKLQNNTRNKDGLLENYLTLIPQNIGYRAGWADNFLKAENFAKQADFLKQLEDAVQWRNTTQAANNTDEDDFNIEDHAGIFRMKLAQLSDSGKEFDRINKKFLSTRSNMHNSRNLRLKRVFAVEDKPESIEAYDKALANFGNEKELWHGTKTSNLLSILTRGLFVPGAGDGIPVTGRLFGNAVYHSDISTKSLGYSNNFWSGGARADQNVFMLLNSVVMGHEFVPQYWNSSSLHHAHKGVGKSGKPYQSISVKGGTCGVINNEMMIWDVNNINIRFLCEFGA